MTVPAVVRNNDKDALTFDEAMGIIGTGYFQIKLAIIGGLVILSSYCAVGVITFVLPVAHCDLNIGYEDRGNLASISFVGLIISCHMWGFLSDTLGRRYILIRCLIFDAILYFITMMTPNFYVFFFVRLFNGVASCGGVVSIYAYIGEFQTDKFRSRALMISSFIAASCYIILPSLAWLIIPGTWQFNLYPGLVFKSWRLYYGVCGIPSLLSAILLFFLPESPKFLLAKGKNEKVVEILRKMYKVNHKKDGELMIKSISMNNVERIGKLDDNKNKILGVCQLLWNQTVPLLKKPHRYNFTLICTALFICYFCNNGMYVWLPEVINRISLYKNFTGNDEGTFCDILDCDNKYELSKQMAMVKMFSSSKIENNMTAIEKVLGDIEEPICYDEVDPSLYLTYILFGIVTLIVWVIIAVTIKYINKKYFILILTTLNLIVTISMKWSSLLILVPIKACGIMLFICGIFPILNSVVVDLFPTNLRAMAGCLTLMASRLGSVVTHEVTGFIIQSHCNLLIWNYIALAAVCLIAVILLPTSAPKPPSSSSSTSTLNIEEQERRTEEV